MKSIKDYKSAVCYTEGVGYEWQLIPQEQSIAYFRTGCMMYAEFDCVLSEKECLKVEECYTYDNFSKQRTIKKKHLLQWYNFETPTNFGIESEAGE